MEKQIIRKNRGITLIALVVTIIVLLILATISIGMLSGNNGILKKSREAKSETIKGEIKDEIGLAWNRIQVDGTTEEWNINKSNIQRI